jgi:hypothetical protein
VLDADFFDQQLKATVARVPGSATVEVALHDGRVYHAYRVDHAGAGYVILEVFPPEGTKVESESTKDGLRLLNSDHVAIPYEAIARVRVTREPPSTSAAIGFHP